MLDMLLLTSSQAGDADALRYVQSTAGLLGVRPLWLHAALCHEVVLVFSTLHISLQVTSVDAWYGHSTRCHNVQLQGGRLASATSVPGAAMMRDVWRRSEAALRSRRARDGGDGTSVSATQSAVDLAAASQDAQQQTITAF